LSGHGFGKEEREKADSSPDEAGFGMTSLNFSIDANDDGRNVKLTA
jgi:hypothetical protein